MPDVFNNLTFAEEALIARIQVAAAAKKLKFGDRSLSGHVSFFDRTANVTEVATVLPNLAANVQILEFTKQVGRAANHTFRDFRVRRHAVQAALLWLCTHSPAYIGVIVDQARIDALPVDGQLQAQVIEVQAIPKMSILALLQLSVTPQASITPALLLRAHSASVKMLAKSAQSWRLSRMGMAHFAQRALLTSKETPTPMPWWLSSIWTTSAD